MRGEYLCVSGPMRGEYLCVSGPMVGEISLPVADDGAGAPDQARAAGLGVGRHCQPVLLVGLRELGEAVDQEVGGRGQVRRGLHPVQSA